MKIKLVLIYIEPMLLGCKRIRKDQCLFSDRQKKSYSIEYRVGVVGGGGGFEDMVLIIFLHVYVK